MSPGILSSSKDLERCKKGSSATTPIRPPCTMDSELDSASSARDSA
jgi:hypothetical protein